MAGCKFTSSDEAQLNRQQQQQQQQQPNDSQIQQLGGKLNSNETEDKKPKNMNHRVSISSTTDTSSLFSHKNKTIGWRIRDLISACVDRLWPYIKVIFPSFIAFHYFYIITFAFLASFILFPKGNMPYIDALFFGAGASTQGGLNTIDINQISLYQQITIYIFCLLTSPIFIHGSLCFVRLYWFERHFDNIRSFSKLNSQMRRQTTLMERQKSLKSQNDEQHSENLNPRDIQRSIHKEENIDALITQDLIAGDYHGDYVENEGPVPCVRRGPSEREIHFEEPNQSLDCDRFQRKKGKLNNSYGLAEVEIKCEDTEASNLTMTHSHSAQSRQIERSFTNNTLKRWNTLDPSIGSNKGKDGFWKVKELKRRVTASGIPERHGSHQDIDDRSITNSQLHRTMSTNYLSWEPQIGRNSTFVNLTDEQKEELGGVEYRALKILLKILSVYFIGFQLLGFTLNVIWICGMNGYEFSIKQFGVGIVWWSFFTGSSSFFNLGYTLTPNSMISFNSSIYSLLVSAFLIIIGNTGLPIFLRIIIWVMFKLSRDSSVTKESLGFLLDHPRRCFTLLFPSAATWWLLFILIAMNVVDLVLFMALDLKAEVLNNLSISLKVLNGFYQSVSSRTAGFSTIDLSQLNPAMQVSYMVMMYISVLPIAISIRRTNVYEEQSLDLYGVPSQGQTMMVNSELPNHGVSDNKPTSFIGAHLRRQLSFDLWFIVLGVLIICIAEGGKIKENLHSSFDIFRVLFEVVSAYGTVGLSLGYPGTSTSFSSQFNVISKLVIIFMMIRGRHRGLPYSLDRAIMLPSELMERIDMEQDLHKNTGSSDLNQSRTVDTTSLRHDIQEDEPVLQFFRSVTPNPIKKLSEFITIFKSKCSNEHHHHQERLVHDDNNETDRAYNNYGYELQDLGK